MPPPPPSLRAIKPSWPRLLVRSFGSSVSSGPLHPLPLPLPAAATTTTTTSPAPHARRLPSSPGSSASRRFSSSSSSSFAPVLPLTTRRPTLSPVSLINHDRNMSSSNTPSGLRFNNPAILICDMQERFSDVIHEFDKIVLTTQKLLAFAAKLDIPVHTTTQTAAKLGPTVATLAALLPSPPVDKTRFSMAIAPIATRLLSPANNTVSQVALVGIESHICVTQTALDLRDAGHRVYVLADAVSSCNPAEVGLALDRLRAEDGITVTSSEGWMYECVGDAASPHFRSLIGVVKASVADTKAVLASLPPVSKI